MILVEKENVQLRIEDKELEKYLTMGFVKYEPKKVKSIEKSLKEDLENKSIENPLKEEQ